MKLETILNAAKHAMLKGRHSPHCYSAHVIGEGYVNKGQPQHDRADYLRQLERTVQSEIENMGFASDYAELGYTKPSRGILFANWNCFPSRFDDLLEKLGFAVEWNDEWIVCGCLKAFRTEADSYVWTPSYKEVHGELMCLECAAIEEGE